MGIAERRERDKLRRRNEILDAAERVFFAKGIDIATMDEVAQAAELSKGTLYLYFESKRDIYLAINIRAGEILESMFETAVAVSDSKSGFDKIMALGLAYFQFSREHPDYFDSMLHFSITDLEMAEPTELINEFNEGRQRIMALVGGAVEEGIRDGSIRGDLESMRTAISLWALSSGMIQIIAKKANVFNRMYGIESVDLESCFFDLMTHALRP